LKLILNLKFIWLLLRLKFNPQRMREIILKRSMELAYMKALVRKKNSLSE
jgi:hypothetical protein